MAIPIVLSTDDNYLPYMATAIQSVMQNSNKQSHYEFIILYINISEENKLLLENQIKIYVNFTIKFINVASYIKDYTFFTTGLSIETYFRLLIPYILGEYKKIIYLDGDIICTDDIAYIYNHNIENNLLGAVKGLAEISGYYLTKPRKRHKHWLKNLGIKNPDNFFNAGVLLFNTEEFRNAFSMQALLNIAASKQWVSNDQGILNVICEDRVYFLPANWNVIPYPRLQNAPEWLKTEHIKAKREAKIIHYGFGFKPWGNANYVPYSIEFWKYAVNTPFTGIITERMERNGLIGFFHKSDIHRMPLKKICFIIIKRISRKIIGEHIYNYLVNIIKKLIKGPKLG